MPDGHADLGLIVLIMPSTNYEPPGYELVERDEQLCRGNVLYTPGLTLPLTRTRTPNPEPEPQA